MKDQTLLCPLLCLPPLFSFWSHSCSGRMMSGGLCHSPTRTPPTAPVSQQRKSQILNRVLWLVLYCMHSCPTSLPGTPLTLRPAAPVLCALLCLYLQVLLLEGLLTSSFLEGPTQCTPDPTEMPPLPVLKAFPSLF